MRHLTKYGLAVLRDNKMLLCRPYAFPDLITPGGMPAAGETPIACLLRQTREELGCDAVLDVTSLRYLDRFAHKAAGKIDATVTIDLYLGSLTGNLCPSSEIQDLVWFSPDDDWKVLSAIIQDKILPWLLTHGLLLRHDSSVGNSDE